MCRRVIPTDGTPNDNTAAKSTPILRSASNRPRMKIVAAIGLTCAYDTYSVGGNAVSSSTKSWIPFLGRIVFPRWAYKLENWDLQYSFLGGELTRVWNHGWRIRAPLLSAEISDQYLECSNCSHHFSQHAELEQLKKRVPILQHVQLVSDLYPTRWKVGSANMKV